MSKLTGLHSIFRKNSIYGVNIGFHALTFARSLRRWRCFNPRTTALVVIQSIVHGWDVEVCCPAFLCENQWQYQAYDNNARTHLTRISKNNVVRIDWSDMSTILTWLWHLWTDGLTHNNGIKKLLAPRYRVAGKMLVDIKQLKVKNWG